MHTISIIICNTYLIDFWGNRQYDVLEEISWENFSNDWEGDRYTVTYSLKHGTNALNIHRTSTIELF